MNDLRLPFFVLAISLFAVSLAGARGAPNFAPGQYICAGETPLLGNNVYSAVDVADWNADGKKDLLVGAFFNGNIWLYLNQGTDEEPIFSDGTLLEADGIPISVGYG